MNTAKVNSTMSNELSYVFFFFKQNTAYEMRISDWSSDVCSSDLLSSSVNEISSQVARSAQIANGAVSEAETTNTQVQGLVDAAHKIGEEIGRASCRERACQYV